MERELKPTLMAISMKGIGFKENHREKEYIIQKEGNMKDSYREWLL